MPDTSTPSGGPPNFKQARRQQPVRSRHLGGDVDPQDIGETVWATVVGAHLLSDAVGDDLYGRLARTWRVLLGGIVPPASLPYFRDFVARTYQAYAQMPLPAQ